MRRKIRTRAEVEALIAKIREHKDITLDGSFMLKIGFYDDYIQMTNTIHRRDKQLSSGRVTDLDVPYDLNINPYLKKELRFQWPTDSVIRYLNDELKQISKNEKLIKLKFEQQKLLEFSEKGSGSKAGKLPRVFHCRIDNQTYDKIKDIVLKKTGGNFMPSLAVIGEVYRLILKCGIDNWED